jgi:hypothetical protein
MTAPDRLALLEEHARTELVDLWADLGEARRHGLGTAAGADPGAWSIRCDGLWERIAMATHLVGPVDPGSVEARLHHLLDQVPPPDPDNLAALHAAVEHLECECCHLLNAVKRPGLGYLCPLCVVHWSWWMADGRGGPDVPAGAAMDARVAQDHQAVRLAAGITPTEGTNPA